MVLQLDLEGTSSGISLRKPTWEEVNDTEQMNVYHLEMTSDLPWEPNSRKFNIQEGHLRTQLNTGTDLFQPKSRQLYPLQMRGPNEEVRGQNEEVQRNQEIEDVIESDEDFCLSVEDDITESSWSENE
jgi:hypothetical protein